MIIKKISSVTNHMINQIDHAHLAYQIASRMAHIQHSPYASNIVDACKHHDDGWEKSDTTLIINPLTQFPYSFLNLPTNQHLTIWNKSLNLMKKHPPLTQYFIISHLLHLATTYEAKKETHNPHILSWITRVTSKHNHILNDINQKTHHNTRFQNELMLIQTADELSLRMCMGSLQACTLAFPHTTLHLQPQTSTRYTLTPYPFKNTHHFEIPYRVYTKNNLYQKKETCIIRVEPMS